jgi:cytochrome c-type biogenesis protein CcmH
VLIWVIFAALTALVLYVLLRPLMAGSAAEGTRAAFDATVYRDQLEEVERDRERGLIGDADAEAARLEIARRLLAADAEERGGANAAAKHPERLVALGLAAMLPDQPLVARLEDPSHSQDLQVLVAKVEARLREHPEEGEGWEVIAPVYMSWQRYAAAAEAFRQTIRLLGESPKRLAGYGQALVLANDGVVTEDAHKALERALVLDPKLIEPRILLTIAKEQDHQFAAAAEGWRGMLANAPQDAPWRKLVEERLAQDEAQLGGSPAPGAPMASGQQGPGAITQGGGGPTQDQVAAAQQMSPAGRQAMIETMVQRLADRLAQNSDDLPGWLKLVRAYSVLDRKDEAVKALARAKTAFSGNAEAIQQLDALAAELGLNS